MAKQTRNETTTRTPPIPTLPALQLETRALLAWAERAFGHTRELTAMDKHAAGLVEAWIRERGGQRQVTAQQVTLLRHASYAATLADVMWGAMQDGVVTDPRLLLEPIKLAALTLERVGLERVARDVNATIRATRKPQVSLEGWLIGRQAPARGVRRKRSNDAALASGELNRSYPGQDAGERGAAKPVILSAPPAEPPHPRDLSTPGLRGTGVPTMHENRPLAGAGQPGPTGPPLDHEPGSAADDARQNAQVALQAISEKQPAQNMGQTIACQPGAASAATRPTRAYLPSARRPGWHARSRRSTPAPAVVDQAGPGPILYFPSKEEGHEPGPAANGE